MFILKKITYKESVGGDQMSNEKNMVERISIFIFSKPNRGGENSFFYQYRQ
jgi:hypothetical protein